MERVTVAAINIEMDDYGGSHDPSAELHIVAQDGDPSHTWKLEVLTLFTCTGCEF